MLRKAGFPILMFIAVALLGPRASAQTQMQVYGVWHSYSDGCNWFSVPDITTFDTDNHWIIDRGNGSPSVNVVVLSFVNPVDLMNLANTSNSKNGIPIGMDTAVVNYFQSKGVRVMFSIGGIRFVNDWDKALNTNPIQRNLASTPPTPPSNLTSGWKSITRRAAIRI